MTVVDSIELALLIGLSGAVLYLYFLAVVGIFGTRTLPQRIREYRFLILVPAFNEESGIEDTLASLAQLEPVGRTEIVVIADNCTDRTAELARQSGARVLERTDPQHRGKGEALEWALGQCEDDCDVVLVTDADTFLEPNALVVIASSLENGAEAVQLSLETSVRDESSLSRLQRIANAVENRCFYRGRSLLHLPILLRGAGMAFRADLLRRYPFHSHSITEDSDFALNLMSAGVRIDFATESAVRTSATSSYRQSQTQRDRWARGTFNLIASRTMSLVRKGLTEGRFDLLEASFSLLLLSRPTLIYIASLALLISMLCSPGSQALFAVWGAALGMALVLYLALGVFFVENKKSSLKALLHAPIFGLWLLAVQLGALFGRKNRGWVRTERVPHKAPPKK